MTIITNRIGGVSSSLAVKAPVRVASTTNLTLSGFQTIDGVALADGDSNLRVLVKDQTDSSQNGIYDANSGTWTRSVDFDGNADFAQGTHVMVADGDQGVGMWTVTSEVDTTFVIDTDDIEFTQTLLADLQGDVSELRHSLGIGDGPAPFGSVIPRTMWLEMDAFQPGIITRETTGSVASFTQVYLQEKLHALHAQGYRRFIIATITDQGRTYTTWTTTPTDPNGDEFHFWYDDVASFNQATTDNFDVVDFIVDVLDELDGTQLIIGLGRHDDLTLLNDLASAWPGALGASLQARLTAEIARYTNESAMIAARFGGRRCFGGFYITHESDHLQSSAQLYSAIADALTSYGDIHVAVATPTDFADSNTIADAVNSFHVDWLWVQTSSGYGYNWSTGLLAYVSGISVFGAAAHLATWRSLIERARGRTGGSYTPFLGGHVENWRIGITGVGTLTFAATSGSNIVVTLGTLSSVVAGDVGKTINVRADQATGLATIVSITDTSHIRVNITETLADVNIADGFWSIVPDLTDGTIDPHPAVASEVAIEIATCGGYVDDYSVYAEAYWDPGNLSLRLRESQANITDYRTRGIAGWNSHAVNLSAASRVGRYWGWNNRGLADPGADRIVFFDNTGGAGTEGAFAFLSMPSSGITISGTSMALANDLAAAEGLATNGIVTRTTTDAWTTRTITGTADQVTVTNGDGVSGDPTLSLSHKVLKSGSTSAAVTGTTAETVLATITVPAGAMGANGWLEIMSIWRVSTSANNKTLGTRLGGIGGTSFGALVTASSASIRESRQIFNRNSQSSQIAWPVDNAGFGGITSTLASGTVATSNAQDLVLTATLSTGSDSATLEAYFVRLFSKS